MRKVLILLLLSTSLGVSAQVGEYRRDFAVGVNGGYVMSNINFMPEVPQKMLGQIGWKENILTMQDQPVPLHTDPSQSLRYTRNMNYIQIPLMARLGWGRERNGLQFFFQVGPQFGLFLSEKTDANFDVTDPAFDPKIKNNDFGKDYKYGNLRASHVVAQGSRKQV